MNRPKLTLDNFNIIGSYQNKCYDYISPILIKNYCPNVSIINSRDPRLKKYVVNKESLGNFFKKVNPTYVFYNKEYISKLKANYSTGIYQILDETNVIVECF